MSCADGSVKKPENYDVYEAIATSSSHPSELNASLSNKLYDRNITAGQARDYRAWWSVRIATISEHNANRRLAGLSIAYGNYGQHCGVNVVSW